MIEFNLNKYIKYVKSKREVPIEDHYIEKDYLLSQDIYPKMLYKLQSPTINGPTSGTPGESYTYTFTSTHPNAEQISYYIDWGDDSNTVWTSFQDPEIPISESHIYTSERTYTIKARIKDKLGILSSWETLEVTMPRNKNIYRPFIQFLEKLTDIFPIFHILFNI